MHVKRELSLKAIAFTAPFFQKSVAIWLEIAALAPFPINIIFLPKSEASLIKLIALEIASLKSLLLFCESVAEIIDKFLAISSKYVFTFFFILITL